MEEWLRIGSFPGYSVSDFGRVRNDRTGTFIKIVVNQFGICYVGLKHDGIDYKRGVAPLVARAFLPIPHLVSFDTPINLDGDRLNNIVANLMWRPRWFAVKYHSQFRRPSFGIKEAIEDLDTGEEFPTSLHAAVKFGLIDRDIFIAVHRGETVWPTSKKFRIIGKRY